MNALVCCALLSPVLLSLAGCQPVSASPPDAVPAMWLPTPPVPPVSLNGCYVDIRPAGDLVSVSQVEVGNQVTVTLQSDIDLIVGDHTRTEWIRPAAGSTHKIILTGYDGTGKLNVRIKDSSGTTVLSKRAIDSMGTRDSSQKDVLPYTTSDGSRRAKLWVTYQGRTVAITLGNR